MAETFRFILDCPDNVFFLFVLIVTTTLQSYSVIHVFFSKFHHSRLSFIPCSHPLFLSFWSSTLLAMRTPFAGAHHNRDSFKSRFNMKLRYHLIFMIFQCVHQKRFEFHFNISLNLSVMFQLFPVFALLERSFILGIDLLSDQMRK